MEGNWHTDPFGGLDDKERWRLARVLLVMLAVAIPLAALAIFLEERGVRIP